MVVMIGILVDLEVGRGWVVVGMLVLQVGVEVGKV